jgi:hypothetical protein
MKKFFQDRKKIAGKSRLSLCWRIKRFTEIGKYPRIVGIGYLKYCSVFGKTLGAQKAGGKIAEQFCAAAGRAQGIAAESPQELHRQFRGLGRPVLLKEHFQNRFAIFQVCLYGLRIDFLPGCGQKNAPKFRIIINGFLNSR